MLTSCMLQLTYKCNLHCKMCFYYGEYGSVLKVSDKQMSVREITKLIKDLKTHHPDIKFVLTGGEVFVRNDLEELFKFLIEKKIKYNIITNGTIKNDNYFKLIAQSNALNISFSLDGPEKINDYIRGAVGSFNRTVENIKYFNSINKGRVPVTIATTISKNNFNFLPDMVTIAKEANARLTIIHLQFLEKNLIKLHSDLTKKLFGKASNCSRWFTEKFSKQDVDIITKSVKLCNRLSETKRVELDFLPNLNENDIYSYYLNGRYHHKNCCTAPFKQIIINPYGDAYPCYPERFEYPLGNVIKDSIKKIIMGKKREKFLKMIRAYGTFPGCLRCCSLKITNPDKAPKFTYVIEK